MKTYEPKINSDEIMEQMRRKQATTKRRRKKEIKNTAIRHGLYTGIGVFFIGLFVYGFSTGDMQLPSINSDTEMENVEDTIIEKIEVETEVIETEFAEKNEYNGIKFVEDVPLSKDIQYHIFVECDGYSISPFIIMAMIERESQFDQYAIGDDGKSFGLMQIQPKWHIDTMIELGCTDLFNPKENISVGMKVLDTLIHDYKHGNDIYWVLMAYNGSPNYANTNMNNGIITEYAREITERAWELEAEFYGDTY